MPRVTLASNEAITEFISQVGELKNALNRTTSPCEDIPIARAAIVQFEAFRDKAFKAFFARKILQLPPVYASQVFGVSPALISQAGGNMNVYTLANENNSSNLEMGYFNLPNGRVVGIPITNEKRQAIFKAIVRTALIKIGGSDIPSFQIRMVAGYMSESDALAFRAGLPTMASVYARCEEQGTTTETQTSETNAPMSATPPQGGVQDMDLSGTTRIIETGGLDAVQTSQLRSLFDALNYPPNTLPGIINATEGVNPLIGFGGASGNALDVSNPSDIRVYFRFNGNAGVADAQQQRLRNRLNRVFRDVGVTENSFYEIEPDGAALGVTFPRVAPASATATGPSQVTDQGAQFALKMAEFGWSGVQVAPFLNKFRERGIEILSVGERQNLNSTGEPPAVSVFVRTQSSTTGMIQLRAAMQEVITGFGGYSRPLILRGVQGEYIIEIERPEEYGLTATASTPTPPTSTSTTTEAGSTSGTTRESFVNEYQVRPDGFRQGISQVDYGRLRQNGYSSADVRRIVGFIFNYGLKVDSVDLNTSNNPHLRVRVSSLTGRRGRSFRSGTFREFLRRRITSLGDSNDLVEVTSPRGRSYQSASFTGTRRGSRPVGILVMPLGNTAPASGTSGNVVAEQMAASMRPTPTGGTSTQIVYLGYVRSQANLIYRSGELRFNKNNQFSGLTQSESYSAMAFFFDPYTQRILSSPLGTLPPSSGSRLSEVLNSLSLDTPGRLKGYSVPENARYVAQCLVGNRTSFTPVRPSSDSPTLIAVDRIRQYTMTEFNTFLGNTPAFETIRDGSVTGSESQTSRNLVNLLTTAQLKSLATSPYSFGFGLELEGYVRQGPYNSRLKLAKNLREQGVKIYVSRGYRSTQPLNNEEATFKRGSNWRMESDGSVGGHDVNNLLRKMVRVRYMKSYRES